MKSKVRVILLYLALLIQSSFALATIPTLDVTRMEQIEAQKKQLSLARLRMLVNRILKKDEVKQVLSVFSGKNKDEIDRIDIDRETEKSGAREGRDEYKLDRLGQEVDEKNVIEEEKSTRSKRRYDRTEKEKSLFQRDSEGNIRVPEEYDSPLLQEKKSSRKSRYALPAFDERYEDRKTIEEKVDRHEEMRDLEDIASKKKRSFFDRAREVRPLRESIEVNPKESNVDTQYVKDGEKQIVNDDHQKNKVKAIKDLKKRLLQKGKRK